MTSWTASLISYRVFWYHFQRWRLQRAVTDDAADSEGLDPTDKRAEPAGMLLRGAAGQSSLTWQN